MIAPEPAAAALDPRTRLQLHGAIVPTLLRMAWPNMLVMLAQAATGLIEPWFVSRLGTDAFRLSTMSEGARIAMGWAAEMTAMLAGSAAREDKVQWLDFDRFLAAPGPGLEVVLDVFGVKYPPEQIKALVEGPIMRQYSKAPEHAYDAALRREVIDQGATENPRELADAMAWLDGAAKEWPEIREAVELAG